LNKITSEKEFIDWVSKNDKKHSEKSFRYNNYQIEEGMLNLSGVKIENKEIRDKHFECTLFEKCVFVVFFLTIFVG
jgi:hypothetical protein